MVVLTTVANVIIIAAIIKINITVRVVVGGRMLRREKKAHGRLTVQFVWLDKG